MTPLLVLVLTLLPALPLFAQTGSCTQIGNFTSCLDSTGRQSTIVDIGGGFRSYSDSKGNTGSIVDLGGGFQQFNITPGRPPAPPPPVFAPASPFESAPGMRGFSSKPGMPFEPMPPLSPGGPEPFGLR